MKNREATGFEGEDEWREQRARAAANADRTGYTRFRFADPGDDEPQVALRCKDAARRHPGCQGTVELSQSRYDWVKSTGSAILTNNGEPPIEDGEIVRCWPCHQAWHERQLESALKLDAKVAELVAEIKTGRRQLLESDLVLLRRYGYASTAQALEEFSARQKSEPEKQAARARRNAP